MVLPEMIQPGEVVRPLALPGLDGRPLDLVSLRGKRYLLSFLRFASCPFCNLRIHELVQAAPQFGPNFTVVAVFASPLDDLTRHAERHHAPFPILADEDGQAHRAYATERSMAGTLKGMFLRAPALMRAMAKGYLPGNPHGQLTAMPADFLVDEGGRVQAVHYGQDEGDHLDLATVLAFSRGQEVAEASALRDEAAVGETP